MKLVHGLYQESSRVMELEVRFHHECPDSDYKSSKVVKLVMGFH